jgi:tetratricopeptide (TPR) repeat protein
MSNRPGRKLAAAWVVATVLLPASSCRKGDNVQSSSPVASPTPAPAASASAGAAEKPDSDAPVGDLNRVGKINFKTSCDAKVQPAFERGVALLHSFFYEEARANFDKVTKQDPNCAIGYWGIAMTHYHPLWAPPKPDEMAAGSKAVEQARNASSKSEQEQAFIDAVAAYYETSDAPAARPGKKGQTGTKSKDAAVGQSCHGPTGGHPERAKAFTAAFEKAHQKYPDDEEVASFYALALLGSAPPVDKSLTNQKKAAELLEPLWAKRQDHPGVIHYLIHAYDYPPLAEKGLPAAKVYASIAPRVAHVQHMPSHIFIRLGMWEEAIASNLESADAARAYGAQKHPDAMSFEELHAFDYLVYAYLQTAQEDKARQIVEKIAQVKKVFPPEDMPGAYALAAIPARFAVERHAWKEAAALSVPEMPFWTKFPFAEAHIEYARGMGRARTGDVEGAKKAVARLAELREACTDPKFAYFRDHLELQYQAVSAWVAKAEGKKGEAVKLMKKAAAEEDKLGKHPVSPGPVYPIREQLGEMLLELDQPAEALAAFQDSLKNSPHRFYALYGAARAAELAKKDQDARKYYASLVGMCDGSGARREELTQAQAFLAKKAGGAAAQ